MIYMRVLDMVNFEVKTTIPSHLLKRNIHVHNEQVYLVRTMVDENKKFAGFITDKLNKASLKGLCLPPKERYLCLGCTREPLL